MDTRAVHGAASTAHQVRTVTVVFTQEDDGRLAIKANGAPGWAAVVRTHEQLAHAVHRAFIECQVAAYSRWKGEEYDQNPYTDPLPPPPAQRKKPRRDVYSPEEWVKTEDGRWLSPSGRLYSPRSHMAKVIEANRIKAGLAV